MPALEVVLDRKRYEEFVWENPQTTSLYYMPWWLDAMVGDSGWKPYVIADASTWAVVPLFEPIDNLIIPPPYTQSGGIVYHSSLTAEARRNHKVFVKRRTLLELFLESHREKRFFRMPLSSDVSDWLPFYWRDYSSSIRYTYQLATCSEDELYRKESSHIRQKVTNGKNENWSYSENISIDDFSVHLRALYKKRSLPIHYLPFLERGVSAATNRGNGFIAGIFSPSGVLLASAFVAHTSHTAYLIATATHPSNSDSAPSAYLLHKIIPSLYDKGITTLDFEGSMIKGVEFFFRSFGAEQVPIIQVSKGGMNIFQRLRLKQYYLRVNSSNAYR